MTNNKLYTSVSANAIMAKQWTELITSSSDKIYSLDSEDDLPSLCSGCGYVSRLSGRSYPFVVKKQKALIYFV